MQCIIGLVLLQIEVFKMKILLLVLQELAGKFYMHSIAL